MSGSGRLLPDALVSPMTEIRVLLPSSFAPSRQQCRESGYSVDSD
jgi:hypothetical protein